MSKKSSNRPKLIINGEEIECIPCEFNNTSINIDISKRKKITTKEFIEICEKNKIEDRQTFLSCSNYWIVDDK